MSLYERTRQRMRTTTKGVMRETILLVHARDCSLYVLNRQGTSALKDSPFHGGNDFVPITAKKPHDAAPGAFRGV
jgi:hypothetical protein